MTRIYHLTHIKLGSRTAFFHLRNIAKIRNILSQGDAEKLVHAFVTSRLDYCNSLSLGYPTYSLKSLQLIQNAAARAGPALGIGKPGGRLGHHMLEGRKN